MICHFSLFSALEVVGLGYDSVHFQYRGVLLICILITQGPDVLAPGARGRLYGLPSRHMTLK